MYRVREDGLQTANAFRNALHGGDAKRGGAAARLAVVRAIAYASSRDMPAAVCSWHYAEVTVQHQCRRMADIIILSVLVAPKSAEL